MQRSKKASLKKVRCIKHEFIAAGHNIQFTSDSIIIWAAFYRESTHLTSTIKIYIHKVTVFNNEMTAPDPFQ